MNQKSSVIQILKSVQWVLTSDTLLPLASLTEQSPNSFGYTNTQAYGKTEVQLVLRDLSEVRVTMLKWVCLGAPYHPLL